MVTRSSAARWMDLWRLSSLKSKNWAKKSQMQKWKSLRRAATVIFACGRLLSLPLSE
jgi:hypothetical protein